MAGMQLQTIAKVGQFQHINAANGMQDQIRSPTAKLMLAVLQCGLATAVAVGTGGIAVMTVAMCVPLLMNGAKFLFSLVKVQ